MGPLISAAQRDSVASFLDAGDPVVFRGSAPEGPGFWFAPTVLAPRRERSRHARGGLRADRRRVIPFRDEADAIALANDTIYGLSGSIWTRDGARALRVARAIETGNLSINSNSSVRVSTPFGGFKQSGYGRELGPHALDAYTEVKTIFYATEGS
jgi:acyl-CoA reductase-like NAD-dependent aldehyde dehydrogenase